MINEPSMHAREKVNLHDKDVREQGEYLMRSKRS